MVLRRRVERTPRTCGRQNEHAVRDGGQRRRRRTAGKLAAVHRLGETGLKYFAQWTDDIAKGELPFAQPERPKGVARNLVFVIQQGVQEKKFKESAG